MINNRNYFFKPLYIYIHIWSVFTGCQRTKNNHFLNDFVWFLTFVGQWRVFYAIIDESRYFFIDSLKTSVTKITEGFRMN